MKQSQLVLSQTPPFIVPLRFLMTAPLFGVAAAILMLLLDGYHFTSRWSTGMLAYTHLLVLGYVAMVMQAALLQVVSVLTGGQPHRVELISVISYSALALGSVLLAVGFLTGISFFMYMAMLLLIVSFILFIGAVISGLLRSSAQRNAGFGIGLALISLLITVGLGAWLALGHSAQNVALARHLTDLHLTFGLVGWGAVLVATVAFAVVPMFQFTPVYPSALVRYLPAIIIVGLMIWMGGYLSNNLKFLLIGSLLVAISLMVFSVVTLWLQRNRKRKATSEVIVWFWRCAMLSLLAAVLVWIVALIFPVLNQHPLYPLLIGVLIIHGFLISVINGMLYKILPFLTWLHLSIKVTEYKLSRRLIPNIKKLLCDDRTHIQFWLHFLMLLLMLAALWKADWFIVPAGIVFAISNLLLWLNLLDVFKIYKKTWGKIIEAAEEKTAATSPIVPST